MKKYYLIAVILIIFFLALSYIGLVAIKYINNKPSNQPLSDKKLTVSTSFYPLYFFTSQIGKDKVDVFNITPAGAEPHDYEPTAQDMAAISHSRLLVLNGGVEAWGNKIKSNLQGTDTQIVVAGDGLINRQLKDESGQVIIDPHIWLSPQLAKSEAQKIAQALEIADNQNSSFYQQNELQLESRFDQLDNQYKRQLSSCKKKDIITSHAAFGYLAQAYGLNQISVAGLSPDAEPSSSQLADVVNFAKKNNVKYIFFESLVSPKLSETIASEVGAKILVLDPLEGLSDDDIKQGKNYFTVMSENLQNLKIALECE